MNVAVTNAQAIRRPNITAIRRLSVFFLEHSGKRAGVEWGDISVVLADNPTIRGINNEHLGHDYETDVISFTFAPMPGMAHDTQEGEIVVNVEYACHLGRRYGGFDHELALYLAHGCDHLSGADDKTPGQRQRMRRRELGWIRGAKSAGLSLQLLKT